MEEITLKSRDNARTPMHVSPALCPYSNPLLTTTKWDSMAPNAGFCAPSTTPWQTLNPSYSTINAASQTDQPSSVYSYWASLLSLRKSHKDLLIYGDFQMVEPEHPDVFAYTRSFGKEKVLVVANFRKTEVEWKAGAFGMKKDNMLIKNYEEVGMEVLKPFEAFACLID